MAAAPVHSRPVYLLALRIFRRLPAPRAPRPGARRHAELHRGRGLPDRARGPAADAAPAAPGGLEPARWAAGPRRVRGRRGGPRGARGARPADRGRPPGHRRGRLAAAPGGRDLPGPRSRARSARRSAARPPPRAGCARRTWTRWTARPGRSWPPPRTSRDAGRVRRPRRPAVSGSLAAARARRGSRRADAPADRRGAEGADAVGAQHVARPGARPAGRRGRRAGTGATAVNAHYLADLVRERVGRPRDGVARSSRERSARRAPSGRLRDWLDGRDVLVTNADVYQPGGLGGAGRTAGTASAAGCSSPTRRPDAGPTSGRRTARPARYVGSCLLPWSAVQRARGRCRAGCTRCSGATWTPPAGWTWSGSAPDRPSRSTAARRPTTWPRTCTPAAVRSVVGEGAAVRGVDRAVRGLARCLRRAGRVAARGGPRRLPRAPDHGRRHLVCSRAGDPTSPRSRRRLCGLALAACSG